MIVVFNYESSTRNAGAGKVQVETNPFKQHSSLFENYITNRLAGNLFILGRVQELTTNLFVLSAVNGTTSSVESDRNETTDLLQSLVNQLATVARSVQSGFTSSTTLGG